MCKIPALASKQSGGACDMANGFPKLNSFRSSPSSHGAAGFVAHSHQELMPVLHSAGGIEAKTKHAMPAPMEFPSLKKDIDGLLTKKPDCKAAAATTLSTPRSHRFLFLGHIHRMRSEQDKLKAQKDDVVVSEASTDGNCEEEEEEKDCPGTVVYDLKHGSGTVPSKLNWSKLLDDTLGPNGPSAVQRRLLNVAERRLVDETFKFYMAILDYEREPTLEKARVMIELYVEAGAKFESGSISSKTRELVIDIIAKKAQLKTKLTGKCFDAIKVELFRDISTNSELGMIVVEAYGRDLLVGRGS